MNTPASLPTPMAPEEREALASEYVLGTLSIAQRRAVQQALATDAALAQAVQYWEQRLLPLAALADPIPPPARAWTRLQAHLQLGPRAPWWQRGWNHLPVWRGLSAASLAAVAVLSGLLLTRQPAAPQFMVVLVAPQDKAAGWVIQASNPREVRLIPLGRFEVPADKALQFWTKADGWTGPVSLGLVQPGKTIQVPLDKLPPLQANQLFELTLEPATGSPIGKPTGPVQFIGRAVPVI